jgi:hypothetical protein
MELSIGTLYLNHLVTMPVVIQLSKHVDDFLKGKYKLARRLHSLPYLLFVAVSAHLIFPRVFRASSALSFEDSAFVRLVFLAIPEPEIRHRVRPALCHWFLVVNVLAFHHPFRNCSAVFLSQLI